MVVDSSAPLRDIAADYKDKNADEMMEDLNKIPFFMNDFKEGDEENPMVEALRAMAYEGEPWEIADNFRKQGNECFKERKYQDAIQFYTQALAQQSDRQDINVACLGNRAQCNLDLKNYRRAITDCSRVLDIEPENLKAWFRSAKAFLQLDKIEESLACIERGLEHDASNAGLLSLREQVMTRKARLEALVKARKEKEEASENLKKTLELALKARGFSNKFTAMNYEKSNPGDLQPHLEDPMDPSSTLYVPVLALYPISMESDIMEQVDELTTIEEICTQLFESPPGWADAQEYALSNLDVYAQTISGGLAKVGKKSNLAKAFGNASVITVDNMARLFIVPRNRAAAWLGDWKKEAQANLLRD